MKIVLCGSMTFSKMMVGVASALQSNGHEVILPHNTAKYADGTLKGETSNESTKNKIDKDLIRDHFRKIQTADSILVVNLSKNGIENYIGGNAFLEMGFAHVLNKPIYLLNDIPKMSYEDEIKAMQPTILKDDLHKIDYLK